MESFSMRVDCPDPDRLQEALWPKLDEYWEYEVFEYASGGVLTIAFEIFYHEIKSRSSLLVMINMDFATAGHCQIDVISGGGEQGPLPFSYGTEKGAVIGVIKILTDICETEGWHIEEDKSEPGKEPD